ncbi:hypothetical protein EDC96DRAFT_570853 [Choanephora cucurbitarum]|nr:hypothetical protein EDC96DRAFT_570853 [Choanephora cucurbitarum]
MHFFFLIVATLAFVMNVNAAAIFRKRAAADVQSCINSLNQVSTQLSTLESTMKTGSLLSMKEDYLQFQDTVASVNTSCCSIHQIISDSDADQFLTSLSHLPPLVESFVATIASKRHEYPEVPNFSILLGMSGVDIANNEMHDCFTKFTPASRNSTLQAYHDLIHTTLYSAADHYPV